MDGFKRTHVVSAIAAMLLSAKALSVDNPLDPSRHYEAIFASAIVLTESDLVSVGFSNFDPNKILGTNNPDFGNIDSIDTAQSITSTSLPTTFYLGDTDGDWLHRVKLRAAWMGVERDFDYEVLNAELGLNLPTDNSRDIVLAGYAEYALGYKLAPRWTLYGGTGLHLMYYENQFEANSPLFDILQAGGVDNYFNTNTYAWIVEPQVDLNYTYQFPLAEWQFNSQAHYFYGENFGGSGGQFKASPEGATISNSIQLKHHLPNFFEHKQDILLRFRRIDLIGDLRDPMQATHYNEYSVGWLIDTSRYSNLIYNVGLGININYGSALKGGSIVFFYNE